MIKNRLKEIIDERNINVSQMADSIGISRSSFYELYKDNASFKNETWTKIANYLHLNIDNLLYSVSDDINISLVKKLSLDSFKSLDKFRPSGLIFDNVLLNFFNKDYAIDIDVPISYKVVFNSRFVFIYYDYSRIDFLEQSFLDNIIINDKNRSKLFNFIYNNYLKNSFDKNMSFVFIKSINGSSINFYASEAIKEFDLFSYNSFNSSFDMEKAFDEDYIYWDAYKALKGVLKG